MAVKPLSHTIALLQGGAFNHRAGELLAEIVKGVEETEKAGKLTITIDVKKAGGAVAIVAKATDKTPEESPPTDLFWSTPEGNLTEQNPNQRRLDLQPAPVEHREVRGA